MIAEISGLIGRYAVRPGQLDGLKLRKVNKIKTIQSSLAIEGNTLSIGQVTDILDGRKVVAPLREIQEVRNAISAYDLFDCLDPFSIKDLLKAHGVMMAALIDDPGKFRSGGVGVFKGSQALHVAPPASRVPHLMQELFDWLKHAEDHLLIRSCVFHYEFEFIHPFADGNGRMGRLWQSLILAKLHPVFQILPVETMVRNNQQRYYAAINECSAITNAGPFIDFMLNEILRALNQHRGEEIGAVNGAKNRILQYVSESPGCRANMIASALGLPLRTVQRYLEQLKKQAQIEFRGASRNGGYFPKR